MNSFIFSIISSQSGKNVCYSYGGLEWIMAQHNIFISRFKKLLNYTVTWWKAEKSESESNACNSQIKREKPYLGVITSDKISISEPNCS